MNIKNPNNDVERRIMEFELNKARVVYIVELAVFAVGFCLLVGFVVWCLLNN